MCMHHRKEGRERTCSITNLASLQSTHASPSASASLDILVPPVLTSAPAASTISRPDVRYSASIAVLCTLHTRRQLSKFDPDNSCVKPGGARRLLV